MILDLNDTFWDNVFESNQTMFWINDETCVVTGWRII